MSACKHLPPRQSLRTSLDRKSTWVAEQACLGLAKAKSSYYKVGASFYLPSDLSSLHCQNNSPHFDLALSMSVPWEPVNAEFIEPKVHHKI